MATHVGDFGDFIVDVAKGIAKGAEGYLDDSQKKDADAKKAADKKADDAKKEAAPAAQGKNGVPMWALIILGFILLSRK